LNLTPETFAQAFRGVGRFGDRAEAEARAWLLTIAHYLRRGSLDRKLVSGWIQMPALDVRQIEEIERVAGLAASAPTTAMTATRAVPLDPAAARAPADRVARRVPVQPPRWSDGACASPCRARAL
jgi:DNA-directed RNA polymerase specialized sigma24 family protein